jgi:phosphoribosyl-AMP cyclohydrolase
VTDPAETGVRFGEDGLVPAIVQDAVNGDVLMLAYMNEEALRLTRETGRAHYWSRSRGALWRKGETSGHEQIIERLAVNCERNSLLLHVRQIGAVCHEGYPTCFYREVAPDGSLRVVRARAFDPDEVYGPGGRRESGDSISIDALAEATRLQYGAYAYLRDHDLKSESGTSRRLRVPEAEIERRVAEELGELAGVLSGEHGHFNTERDLLLEASQVIYWLLLATLREGVTWARLRPDRALNTAEDGIAAVTVAQLLRADAGHWRAGRRPDEDLAATAHATLALVGQVCHSSGIDPLTVIAADLDDLRSRPYLRPYFAREAA